MLYLKRFYVPQWTAGQILNDFLFVTSALCNGMHSSQHHNGKDSFLFNQCFVQKALLNLNKLALL